MNNKSTSSNKIELNKIPGFDILEKLPDEQMLKSYNEEFYNSLSNVKITSLPLIHDHNRLLYHFEQNDNASVSTTTGQLFTTFEELVLANEKIKTSVNLLKDDIVHLKDELRVLDQGIYKDYRPEILKMQKNLQNVLVDQKTENFKLVKEIALLEKEKVELQNSVYVCLGKLHKLEREVGVKSKAYTYLFDQSIIENEINNKFIIEKEEI